MQRYAACRLAQSSFAPRTKNAFLNTRRYSQPPKATNSNANGPTDAPWLVPDDSAPVPARPSWVLASSSLLRVVLVPVGLVYAVFFHDFGQEEHVFMPPRRWLQRQKDAFFTLSPSEKQLVAAEESKHGEER